MPEIKAPADADAYLDATWSGNRGGPVVTLGLLLNNAGYFEVPHLIFSYLDFLAGLWSGRGRQSQMSDICGFIRQYFPSPYHPAAGWLVFQYRHGLVHEYAPKRIDLENGKVVGWASSLGDAERAEHLQVLPGKQSGQFYMHLNANQLLDDFKAAIGLFRHDVVHDAGAFAKFQQACASFHAAPRLSSLKHPYLGSAEHAWLRAQVP